MSVCRQSSPQRGSCPSVASRRRQSSPVASHLSPSSPLLVTSRILSLEFICPFARRAKMERGYNQDHQIGDEIVRTLPTYSASCNLFSSPQSYEGLRSIKPML